MLTINIILHCLNTCYYKDLQNFVLSGGVALLQCVENPRDEGAWWASVYGVAQSQTQL